MLTLLLSFLGGNAFRMVFGEVVSWLNKKQDHEQEMARMRFQAEQDAAQHARNLESIRLQADKQVEVIRVQSEKEMDVLEAQGWLSAVNATAKATGIAFIDGWNACIRPAVATWAVVMLTLSEVGLFAMSENAAMVVSAALGIYLADRSLFKRGK